MSEKREIRNSIPQKLLDINVRYIYLLLFVTVAIPLIKPIGLPITISDATRNVHDMIMNLEPEDNVLIITDLSSTGLIEEGPGLITGITDIFLRPEVKLVISAAGGFVPVSPMLFDSQILPKVEKSDKVYGVDYVLLGWTTGGETAMAALADNIRGLYSTDYYGTSLDKLTVLDNINGLEDFDMIIYSGGGNTAEVMRQIFEPTDVPGINIASAIHKPQGMPYVPDLIQGYIYGLAQGAEYELLIGKPGKGIVSSDALSLSQILVFTLLVGVNLAYILTKNEGRKK